MQKSTTQAQNFAGGSVFRAADAGISMVEIVISMLLLSVLSLALLPLIMGLSAHSVSNGAYLQATGFAEDILGQVQSDFPAEPGAMTSCAALQTKAGTVTDPAGDLEATVSVGACPSVHPDSVTPPYPGSTTVLITVSQDGTQIAKVSSRVRVGAA